MSETEGTSEGSSLSTDKPVEKAKRGILLRFDRSIGKLFTANGTITDGQEFRVSKKESKRYLKIPGVSVVEEAGE